MRRHPFDPIALVLGLAFATAGAIVLAGGDLASDGHFLLPATLLGLGVALLLQNAARNRPPRPDPDADAGDPEHRAAVEEARRELDDDAAFRTASGVYWPGAPGDAGPQDVAGADEPSGGSQAGERAD